jgi:hypothetical protein
MTTAPASCGDSMIPGLPIVRAVRERPYDIDKGRVPISPSKIRPVQIFEKYPKFQDNLKISGNLL